MASTESLSNELPCSELGEGPTARGVKANTCHDCGATATEADTTFDPAAAIAICSIQTRMRQEKESPLDATKRILRTIENISSTNKAKVDIFVLPELSPVAYCKDTFDRYLPRTYEMKRMFSHIDENFAKHAKRLGVFICYGTIGWIKKHDDGDDNSNEEAFTIRQKVVDRNGHIVAVYDKFWLCDYGDCNESQVFQAGRELVSFEIDGFRFGILICADMRDPTLCRSLARDHKVDVLLQPAAFSRDCSFRTWKSFRETRAVENSCYFVGVNYGGDVYGDSSFVPPWVDDEHVPKELGTEEDGFLIERIERSVLDFVRSSFPFHRRLWKDGPPFRG